MSILLVINAPSTLANTNRNTGKMQGLIMVSTPPRSGQHEQDHLAFPKSGGVGFERKRDAL
jgi:hypothetical protein